MYPNCNDLEAHSFEKFEYNFFDKNHEDKFEEFQQLYQIDKDVSKQIHIYE